MFKNRLIYLKKLIKDQNIDGLIISSVSNITYLTGYSNFSRDEREAFILIGKDFQFIITDGRYSEAVKKNIAHFTLYERGQESSLEDLLKKLKNKIEILAVEEDNLTISEYKIFKKHFKRIKHFSPSSLRSIKDGNEINKIQRACNIGDQVFKDVIKKIKVGMSEKQVGLELESLVKKRGAEFSFPPIVAFSKNSSIPHHHTGDTKLDKKGGQFILMDFGVKMDNYCSDMTRTVFFGKPSNKQVKIYYTVLEAQQKAINFINLNLDRGKEIFADQVDKIARDFIISQGFESIPHSVGHGIGIEVHEHPHISPKSKEQLKEGIVFSIEPGIYIPKFGGVRIEDLFVYENSGLRQITNSSKDITIIQ